MLNLVFSFSEKRCPTLAMPANGGFKCVDGSYFNSRCEYYCSPGYTLKGERTVTCMDNKAWSGQPASCVGKTITALRRCVLWEEQAVSSSGLKGSINIPRVKHKHSALLLVAPFIPSSLAQYRPNLILYPPADFTADGFHLTFVSFLACY